LQEFRAAGDVDLGEYGAILDVRLGFAADISGIMQQGDDDAEHGAPRPELVR
jgi:hypothetical protein